MSHHQLSFAYILNGEARPNGNTANGGNRQQVMPGGLMPAVGTTLPKIGHNSNHQQYPHMQPMTNIPTNQYASPIMPLPCAQPPYQSQMHAFHTSPYAQLPGDNTWNRHSYGGGGNYNKRRNTGTADRQVVARCDPCERDFYDTKSLEAHKNGHILCSYTGCEYSASKNILLKHIITEHEKYLPKLDTDEDVSKWREERRRNFPSKNRIEEKKKDLEDRRARGEVIVEKPSKYNLDPFQFLSDGGTTDKYRPVVPGQDRKGKREKKRHCKYFDKGHCRHGESCRYLHDPSAQKVESDTNPNVPIDGESITEKSQPQIEIKTKSKKRGNQTRSGDIVLSSRRPKLRTRLLHSEIKLEMSVVLQCFRRFVQTNFKSPYIMPNKSQV